MSQEFKKPTAANNRSARLAPAKPKDSKKTFRRLVARLRPFRLRMSMVIVLSALSAAFSIIGPKITGKLTTRIFEGYFSKIAGQGGIDFDYIWQKLLLLAGLYLISSLFFYFQGALIVGVAQKLSYTLREQIASKINRLPLRYFDKVSYGDVLSRVTNDIDMISQTLNQSLSQIISAVVTVIGVLVMMLSISWQMTLVAFLIVPLTILLTAFIAKMSQKFYKSQQKSLGEINGLVEESYNGQSVLKAFGQEENKQRQFDALNANLYANAWKSQFLSGMMMPAVQFIGNIGYVAVSITGAALTVRKVIEVGDILSFVQYMRTFTQPLAQVAQVSNIIQSTLAAAERVFEFLDEEEMEKEDNQHRLPAVSGQVEFEHVRFGYEKDHPILHDFSAQVTPGMRIAIVGPTGAGKTTLIKLLMRYYELDAGAIYIDGQDIAKVSREDLRSQFGIVLQDTWLFNGTILDNIRYADPAASDEKVYRAADLAHADHFIRALPGGYQMVINEDMTNLSQGQKQLLTIARAILADPKILILDEATSSVDTRTEQLIQKAFLNLMKDRTSFIIAHRLSTIRDADLILVMKDGNIIEQGSHEELLAKGGFYEELYNSQFDEQESA